MLTIVAQDLDGVMRSGGLRFVVGGSALDFTRRPNSSAPTQGLLMDLRSRKRHQSGLNQAGDVMGDKGGAGVLGVEIGEDDDGEVVVDVARNVAGEALPRAAVFEDFVAVHGVDFPAEAVIGRVGFAVVERINGPDAVEAGLFQKLRAVERAIPFGEVENVEVKGAVGGGIESRRNPGLILELAAVDFVAGGAIGDDVGVADEAG